jgi:hypothetical protein
MKESKSKRDLLNKKMEFKRDRIYYQKLKFRAIKLKGK